MTFRKYLPIPSLLIAGLFLAIGCDSDQGSGNEIPQTEPIAAPAQPEPSPGFEELNSDYYKSDIRVIWQKPNLVLNMMGSLEDKVVADIGAGTGYFAFRIAGEGANVIAIDIDPRAIEFMESEEERYPEAIRERFETRLATADNARLKDNEVDIALLVNTYIYIEDRINYFRDLAKGLTPGGKVFIVDFKDIETTIGPSSDQRIGLSQVQRELTEAGYTIESADVEMLQYQYIVVATMP